MKTDHKQVLLQMMAPYHEMLDHLMGETGDFSHVDYVGKKDATYGKRDANYTNRFKVLLAIHHREDRHAPHYESIVRRLLMNEIIDRQTNSYQDIGEALYYCVFLLKQYNRDEDQKLFSRAKEANFDTISGFEPNRIREQHLFHIDTADLSDCIRLSEDLLEMTYHSTFVDLWIAEQTCWNQENLTELLYIERNRKHIEGEIGVLRKLAAIEKTAGNDHQYCYHASNLAEMLITQGQFEEATLSMESVIPLIIKEDRWCMVGLGRQMIQTCINIMYYYGADSPHSFTLWKPIEGYLEQAVQNMSLSQYDRVTSACQFMGNIQLAQIFIKNRDKHIDQYNF